VVANHRGVRPAILGDPVASFGDLRPKLVVLGRGQGVGVVTRGRASRVLSCFCLGHPLVPEELAQVGLGIRLSMEALASTLVASKKSSSPHTSPASTHFWTILSKKRRKIERPKRSLMRVGLC
jgi:hypothetical protein